MAITLSEKNEFVTLCTESHQRAVVKLGAVRSFYKALRDVHRPAVPIVRPPC
jgi:hypothetical protein